MKKLIKIIVACLVCLSIVGCSSGSGGGTGKKTKNPDFIAGCKPFDFFDALIKEEYFIPVGIEGQGDLFFDDLVNPEGTIVYEGDDFLIKKEGLSYLTYINYVVYKDDEAYANVELGIKEYKEKLKNGDEVLVYCNVHPNINGKFLKDLGYDSEYSTMLYKINGLPNVVTSAKNIDRDKLVEAIFKYDSHHEAPIISLHFLTLKEGEEPYRFDYSHISYTDENDKAVIKYSTDEYDAESIIFIYLDIGASQIGDVPGMQAYELIGIVNPDENNIYDGHTYDSFGCIDKDLWGREWNPERNGGFENLEDYFQKEFPQYDVVEIK